LPPGEDTEEVMRRPLTILTIHALIAASVSAAASTSIDDAVLRPRTELVRSLVAQGVLKSPTFRELVERLERSDLIVYIDVDPFPRPHLHGALNLVVERGGRRYVRITLDPHNHRRALVAWLGHELQHAAELADHPEINTVDRLTAYYGTHE